MEQEHELAGIDLNRLGEYLVGALGERYAVPLSATVIAGGRSNLTYLVTDARGEQAVLRRPPLGHVLATAHDMGREVRVLRALRPSAVPVPRVEIYCEDPEIIGSPFYVMEAIRGTPYRLADQLVGLGAARTELLCGEMIRVLAELHRLDCAALGISDLGRPDGYLSRQVRRWNRQIESSRTRDIPGLDLLVARLESELPQDSESTLVHGDYRIDNLLINDQDQVAAVLDWEMATRGDPLADIALTMAYMKTDRADSATRAPGFFSVSEVLESYLKLSGRDGARIGYYLALSYFKMIGIREGIYFRYLQGQTVGEGFAEIGASVLPLVRLAMDALEGRL